MASGRVPKTRRIFLNIVQHPKLAAFERHLPKVNQRVAMPKLRIEDAPPTRTELKRQPAGYERATSSTPVGVRCLFLRH